MKRFLLAGAATLLFAGPALAQIAPPAPPPPHPDRPSRHDPYHRPHHKPPPAHHRAGPAGANPNDAGPFTPEANRAYMGGGVILEGAPGAPAPRPEPTPPGQAPRNMVPMQ